MSTSTITSNYVLNKYVCTKETLKQTIDQYGVAVILNVLNEDECTNMVKQIWDFFEHISQTWETPINRNDQTTWRSFYKLYPLHSMLIQHWNVGHAEASWNLRQNINIINIFAYFWGCSPQELLVSFDGLSFNLPPEITKKGWNIPKNTVHHTDQSFTTNDFKCIQSFVTGLDINEYDATFSFMEGSNKYHQEFATHFNITNKDDWYKLTHQEEQFYLERGCEYKKIKCPKGSMVFWDSRTIHCGVEASKLRKAQNIRMVVYLCFMPRNLSNEANLKKKQKAFNELRTTTHNPCKIKLFSKTPRTYGGEVPEITQIEQTI